MPPRAASCGYHHYIHLSTYLRFVMTPSSGSSSLPLSFFLPSRVRLARFTPMFLRYLRAATDRANSFPINRNAGSSYNNGAPSAADRLHFTPPMDFTRSTRGHSLRTHAWRYCNVNADEVTPTRAIIVLREFMLCRAALHYLIDTRSDRIALVWLMRRG